MFARQYGRTGGNAPNPTNKDVCKFYLEGRCRFGDACRNYHPPRDSTPSSARNTYSITAAGIKADLTVGDDKPSYPLSSYGPGKDAPRQLLEGALEQSPEELRVQFYLAQASGSTASYEQTEREALQQAERRAHTILNDLDGAVRFVVEGADVHPNREDEVVRASTNFQWREKPGAQSAGTTLGQRAASPFGQASRQTSAFGQASALGSTSTFGQPSAGTSAFGQPSQPAPQTSAFGQPSQPGSQGSAFGRPSGLGGGSAFGNPSQLGGGSSAFGQNVALGGGTSFGQASKLGGGSAFGQPSTLGAASPFGQSAGNASNSTFGQPSSANNGPSPFGQTPNAATSGFGQVSSSNAAPSPFAAASGAGPSSFGQSAANPGGSTFGQPSNFGAASSGGAAFGKPSPFGATSQPGASAFGQPSTSAPQTSAFGQPSAPGQSASPFGQPSAPGTGQNAFGKPSPFGTAAAAPNGSTFGQPSQPNAPSAFGQPSSQPSQQPAFSANPTPTAPRAPGQPLTSFHGAPVAYEDKHAFFTAAGGKKERIWFPDGPPPANADVEARDPQHIYEGELGEVLKRIYAFVAKEGRFEGGVVPEVPPRREWVSFDL